MSHPQPKSNSHSQLNAAISEYTPRAANYDTSNNAWHTELANLFITLLNIPPHPPRPFHALDLACGTGLVTTRLATAIGPHGTVIAADITPAMLDIARSKPRLNHSAPIEFVECDISSPSLLNQAPVRTIVEQGGFDVITCCSALILLDDPAAAIRLWATLLRSGGKVIVDVPTEDLTVQYLATEILGREVGVSHGFAPNRTLITGRGTLEGWMESAGLVVRVDRARNALTGIEDGADDAGTETETETGIGIGDNGIGTLRTKSWLPERTFHLEDCDRVFDDFVMTRFGRVYVERGLEGDARAAWRGLWEQAVDGRDGGGVEGVFRDGHWLYITVGWKPE